MSPGSSERAEKLREELESFMESSVYPAERVYREQLAAAADPHALPPVVEALKAEARARGLWNLFLPDERWGAGLTNLEYAPLAEITGRSIALAPEALNCAAPDTGNVEVLVHYGSPEHHRRWLGPLLAGEIRSAFCMTEPGVASSDATNIETAIVLEGDDYVIDGTKWWSSGTADPRCAVAIVMGITDPDAEPHSRHSMVLVPLDADGVQVQRDLTIFGYSEQHGHGEVRFDNVRVPRTNLLGEQGGGFAISQARLGPGRIHHCMRAVGLAERALDLMIDRSRSRVAFGGPLSDQGLIQSYIAESRIELDQARLLVLHTARLMDTVGNRGARTEIAAIKVVAARVAGNVIDRAIQVFGAAGLSQDFPLAYGYAHARMLRLADGPDEVHLRTVARQELKRRAAARSGASALVPSPSGGIPR